METSEWCCSFFAKCAHPLQSYLNPLFHSHKIKPHSRSGACYFPLYALLCADHRVCAVCSKKRTRRVWLCGTCDCMVTFLFIYLFATHLLLHPAYTCLHHRFMTCTKGAAKSVGWRWSGPGSPEAVGGDKQRRLSHSYRRRDNIRTTFPSPQELVQRR